jgi:tetratricopeptide (TPR) repeat protein
LGFRGGLLLAEAQFTQKNFPAAEAALTTLTNWQPGAELNWQRQYWLCRVQLADARAGEALNSAQALVAMAGGTQPRAESVALQASILEQLHRPDEAIAAYQENLGADVPPKRQREALLKIAELSLAQGRLDDAAKFLRQITNSPVMDTVLFTLGDLQLKQYLASLGTNPPADMATSPAGETNFLRMATAQFQSVLDQFPNSELAGRALLNQGWCLWLGGDIAGSLNAFQSAEQRLPPLSEDQLVARFKWADAQSRSNDFAGAITNYYYVVTGAQASAGSNVGELIEPALYQLLRASLDGGDMKSAGDALTQILNRYPDSFIAERSLLLTGQGFALRQDTAQARELLTVIKKRSPDSPLLPEVGLAVARTYELEQNWTNAIQQYDDWLETFTNNPARPRAEFYRAWANFQAGNETNALTLFTNLVARFPTSEFAPGAKWWVADHYFRLGEFQNAEVNYKLLFQNWPASDLAYEARMMAGRAAVARIGYPEAIEHFTNLTSNPNCPADLRARAAFAYGDMLMQLKAADTNKFSNLEEAIRVFTTIPSTNQLFAAALGRIGDCYLQWAAFDAGQYHAASNFYQQVAHSPVADVATRSQAEIRLGFVAEKQASSMKGDEPTQTALLKQALDNYRDVLFKNNLRDGEMADPFSMKKARLEAARLSETLNEWTQAVRLYRQLADSIPASRTIFENKIEKIVKEHPEAGQN